MECKDYAEWVDGVDRGEGLIEGRTSRRAVARALARRPRLRLGLTLSGPLLWLLVAYIGSLVALLITSLYHNETVGVSTEMVTEPALDNYRTIVDNDVYRDVAVRTVGAAIAVTAIDLVIALPVAFFMAKVATTRARRQLVIAVTMPLVGRVPREGLRVARDAQPRERVHRRRCSASRPATASGARSSCWPTSGCRTW